MSALSSIFQRMGYDIYIVVIWAGAFIQSNLQLIRLSRRQPPPHPTPLEQCGVKGFAQGPNSCTDLIVATPGLEQPTFRVPVMYLSHLATGFPHRVPVRGVDLSEILDITTQGGPHPQSARRWGDPSLTAPSSVQYYRCAGHLNSRNTYVAFPWQAEQISLN